MIVTAGSRIRAGEMVHMHHGRAYPCSLRDYTKVSKEQRRLEQMDKLRRTLAKSERKRRGAPLAR